VVGCIEVAAGDGVASPATVEAAAAVASPGGDA